jgi:hypothetical protein
MYDKIKNKELVQINTLEKFVEKMFSIYIKEPSKYKFLNE